MKLKHKCAVEEESEGVKTLKVVCAASKDEEGE